MLKKIIVGILVVTVAVAVGASIYNPSAAGQAEVQIDTPAAAPTMQAQAAQVDARTTNATSVTSAPALVEPAQTAAGQNQGAWSGVSGGGGYGGGRGTGQGAQGGLAARINITDANGGITPGGRGPGAGSGQGTAAGQGTGGGQGAVGAYGAGGASGRPDWAGQSQGQGQGRQP